MLAVAVRVRCGLSFLAVIMRFNLADRHKIARLLDRIHGVVFVVHRGVPALTLRANLNVDHSFLSARSAD